MALTAQEQAELAQLEKEVGAHSPQVAAPSSSGLSPEEHAEMQALEKDVGHLTPEPAQSPGLLSKVASGAAGALGYVGKKVDQYADAPTRSAIMAAQTGENPLTAFGHQFGEDPSKAPSGHDIMVKAGVPDQKSIMTGDQKKDWMLKNGTPFDQQEAASGKKYDDVVSPSPADVLGKGVDLAASPLNALPLLSGLKGAAPLTGASDLLKGVAEERAFKALGPTKAIEDANRGKGLVNSIGRTALDEGVVSPLASKKTMLGRSEDLANRKTGELQGLLDNVSQNKNLSPEQIEQLKSSQFVPASAAEDLKSKIKNEYSELPQEVIDPRLKQVDMWLSGKDPKNIQQAQNFKTQMSKFIKDSSFYKDNPGASQDTLLGIRNAAKEGIEKNADAYANMLGEEGGQIKDVNRQTGNAIEMGNILDDRVSRDAANRSLSLTDYLAAIAGHGQLGPKGLLLAPVNKFAREKGSQLMATGADKLAEILANPEKLSAISQGNAALGLLKKGQVPPYLKAAQNDQ